MNGDALSLTHIEVSAKINCNNLHILTYNKIACIHIQASIAITFLKFDLLENLKTHIRSTNKCDP